ncbi:AsmA family protein [Mucilaginibacter sp. HMF5004]|uniref:AsmA family protein n=1 Tax=Mucilaginibacter rivuli TaxID=2857527 RepID=UPI001C5E21F4|nr:AsmA family protein [Mucilaginibacter rivuli]MBW4891738.1 AsmA family protein [Mucilaginibacter rivuli]
MNFPVKRILLKILKITGITLGSLLLLMFLLPVLFPKAITQKINVWANSNINGKIAFTGTGLSFFKHFPELTLTLDNVVLKGSAPFEVDTLVSANEISLGIDLSSVFKSKININKIYLSNAFINIETDKSGRGNYNIYKPGAPQTNAKADTGSASLGIEKILIEKSRLVYDDMSLPMQVEARDFNYTGSGDLSKDVFDLHTHTEIGSLDFFYANKAYILSKKVNADLVTKINTKSLAFIFQKNDLLINRLPVQFTGKFAFIKDGYDMDFKVDSHDSHLKDIFTALPAVYQKMIAQTDIDGIGNIKVELKGKYLAKTNTMPNLSMNFKVRDGYVSSNKAPAPVKNLFVNLDIKVPGLSPDSLLVNLDSIYFNIGKDYFSSVMRVKGFKTPDIYAKINTEIDLEKWNRAFGIKPFEVKGRYTLHLLAQGKYATGIEHVGLRKIDTVITSIPKFTVQSSFKNGYFKYASLPQAIQNISFNFNAACPDNNYRHISMAMDNLNITALDNYIRGYFKMSNAADFPVDAELKSKFNLAELKQFYPLDSIDLKGNLFADIKTNGKYLPAKKKFPATVANISLKDGSIQTKYYPHPIHNIQVNTSITNRTGTLNGTNISVKPISFSFENEPFMLKAELHNFADVDYNVSAHGMLNIGKIYKVFAVKGYNVNGKIAANLAFKGKQSDVLAKRYDKLQNSGKLSVKDVALTSDLFPKPFLINRGVFSFEQDKMKFDSFTANYGNSVIVLNGALSNVISYALKPGSVLKGDFNLSSNQIVVDDFMAFAGSPSAAGSSTTTGVIIVPKNLDLNFTADVKKLKYQDLTLNDAKSQMTVNNGNITLKQTGFNLIGSPVAMDAAYTNATPNTAYFNYHISANDFDIKKAYNHIKLFHDMVTSAAHAEGLISLDYNLSGRLNANMQPVYSSLKGGGELSAKQIKMHGFKLMGSIAKSTNRDSISRNPDVSKVAIKTTIAKNIITIERTKLRMAGFRARFEGQVSFDKRLNIQFRLGLPPLGIIGIPLTITGTQDKPKIRLGKGKKEDTLEGTDDPDSE